MRRAGTLRGRALIESWGFYLGRLALELIYIS